MTGAADRGLPRRAAIIGTAAAAFLGAGCATERARPPEPTTGLRQAGITHPTVPQPHCRVVVADFTGRANPADVLAAIGAHLLDTASTADQITVTAGIGPTLVRAAGRTLPGADALPRFANEDIRETRRGGDLVLQICAATSAAVDRMSAVVIRDVARGALSVRWEQAGSRGPSDDTGTTRNPLGFLDGTVNPRSPHEVNRDVWIDKGPAAGGTIMVVRRLRLDIARFAAMSREHQERVIGREKATGEPLSGGGQDAPVDLHAKHDDGVYRIPADAHVRRAHSLASGVGMMLRRPYAYHNRADDQGLLFVSFQNRLRTFVNTQHRMDERDALMPFTTATASGSFLILPGFTRAEPLGATVLRAQS